MLFSKLSYLFPNPFAVRYIPKAIIATKEPMQIMINRSANGSVIAMPITKPPIISVYAMYKHHLLNVSYVISSYNVSYHRQHCALS